MYESIQTALRNIFRGMCGHLGEQVANAGGADADEHLYELRAGDGEEGHSRLLSQYENSKIQKYTI
jgi:hypothetical protein